MSEASSREFRPDLDREFQYLLGQMPRVDRETFQGILIENPDVSERVLEAENELYDAWARGDLPRDWHPMFEERMLSTAEGKRKATIAKSLVAATRRAAAEAPGSGGGFGSWWRRIAAAICVAGAMTAWFWWQRQRGETPGPQAQQQQQTAALQTEVLRMQILTRGSAERPKFRIGASAKTVRFAVPESEPATMELSTLEGKIVWKGSGQDAAPAALLAPGGYLLTTFDKPGGAATNYYEFEILGQ